MSDTPRTICDRAREEINDRRVYSNCLPPSEAQLIRFLEDFLSHVEGLERENAELEKKVDIAKEAIAQLSDELKELHELREDSEGDAEQILMLTQRVETLTRENEKMQSLLDNHRALLGFEQLRHRETSDRLIKLMRANGILEKALQTIRGTARRGKTNPGHRGLLNQVIKECNEALGDTEGGEK